jgi:hypothetical protein
MNKIKYLAAALVAVAGLGFQQANATPLGMCYTCNDTYLVGTVIPTLGGQFGGQPDRDVYAVNVLSLMPAPSQQTTGSGTQQDPYVLWSRTTWPQGPTATTDGAVIATGGGINVVNGIVQITLTQTYQYLVAAYDGPNSGTAVFDISSFATGSTIEIYAYAYPDTNHPGDLIGATSGQYFITSFVLLNPTPDGGATVMLLGVALGALGVVRRYFAG